MKEQKDFQAWKAEVLLYFTEAPLAEAVKTLEEATGRVESRRITEKYPEEK